MRAAHMITGIWVESGFRLIDETTGRPAASSWRPAKEWDTRLENEWIFMYSRWVKLYCHRTGLCVGLWSKVVDARQHLGRPQPDTHPVHPCMCRPGYANRFRLHCVLHEQSGRMFVHATEISSDNTPIADNVQVLGLQVDRYCHAKPPQGALSWAGAFCGTRGHAVVGIATPREN